MTASARDRMAALLAGAGARGSFSAAETAPADGLRLEVRGLGPLVLPVTDEQARRLCSLGRPAPYGRGEQTLVDAAVRDTWEIPKARVKIDKRRWADTLEHVLERLGRDLSLPDGRQLEAQLHSMLVYAPGQFFLRHQDSEKEDAMVGSLVVTLPSAFTGGALEVEHRGEVATYRGSKKALSFVAFYSDCRHQIKPVTSGHRVVLTFDLTLRGDLAASPESAGDPELIEELARYLGQHFEGRAAPSRLVYLLDHEYTPRGLSWSCLKGADVARATMLR
ncbi:MAG: 2OG-Fe(II) oxygenase, partial [Acidimicrobiales bacterium]